MCPRLHGSFKSTNLSCDHHFDALRLWYSSRALRRYPSRAKDSYTTSSTSLTVTFRDHILWLCTYLKPSFIDQTMVTQRSGALSSIYHTTHLYHFRVCWQLADTSQPPVERKIFPTGLSLTPMNPSETLRRRMCTAALRISQNVIQRLSPWTICCAQCALHPPWYM